MRPGHLSIDETTGCRKDLDHLLVPALRQQWCPRALERHSDGAAQPPVNKQSICTLHTCSLLLSSFSPGFFSPLLLLLPLVAWPYGRTPVLLSSPPSLPGRLSQCTDTFMCAQCVNHHHHHYQSSVTASSVAAPGALEFHI